MSNAQRSIFNDAILTVVPLTDSPNTNSQPIFDWLVSEAANTDLLTTRPKLQRLGNGPIAIHQ